MDQILMLEPRAFLIVSTKYKYKGKWGVRKPASTILVEYEVNGRILFVDLQLRLPPDEAQLMVEHFAELVPLTVKPASTDIVEMMLLNDSEARTVIRSFQQTLLPKLKASDYGEYLEVEAFFCGDLSVQSPTDVSERNEWDDSKELTRQYLPLDDGRVIVAILWGESDEVYLEYHVPAVDLIVADRDELMRYLSDNGCAVFTDPTKYPWSLSQSGGFKDHPEEYVLQTSMTS